MKFNDFREEIAKAVQTLEFAAPSHNKSYFPAFNSLLIIFSASLLLPCFAQKGLHQTSPINLPRSIRSISKISIAGCYSDTTLNKSEGIVVGNGFLTIKKSGFGRYSGIFSELAGDSGASYPEVRLRNLRVNEAQKTLAFDLPLHSGVILKARGRISLQGLKLNWGNRGAGDFGQPSPLMRRKKMLAFEKTLRFLGIAFYNLSRNENSPLILMLLSGVAIRPILINQSGFDLEHSKSNPLFSNYCFQ